MSTKSVISEALEIYDRILDAFEQVLNVAIGIDVCSAVS